VVDGGGGGEACGPDLRKVKKIRALARPEFPQLTDAEKCCK
jgi:hypothetical protein